MNIEHILAQLTSLQGKNISEADTGRLLIEPTLLALGYDIYNWDMVREQVPIQEASAKANVGRADYGIRIDGRYAFMIEAKKLGANSIFDPAEIKKMLDYCMHEDRPRFAIMTDGQKWNVYDNEIGGRTSDRLILSLDILDPNVPLNIISFSSFSHIYKFADLVKEIKINNTPALAPLLIDIVMRDFMSSFECNPTPKQMPQNYLNLERDSTSIQTSPLHSFDVEPLDQEDVLHPFVTIDSSDMTGSRLVAIRLESPLTDGLSTISCDSWILLYRIILQYFINYNEDKCINVTLARGTPIFCTSDIEGVKTMRFVAPSENVYFAQMERLQTSEIVKRILKILFALELPIECLKVSLKS